MSKLLSDRVKKIPPTEVSDERYKFLKLSEAEPDLGVPVADNYILTSDIEGNRLWTNEFSLQGIQGIQGIQGAVGPQGIQGNIGQQGIQGNIGQQGIQGIQGQTGPQGIQGNLGAQGIQGIQGTQGIQGSSATDGTDGTSGPQGAQGNTGQQGIQGTIGPQGIQGITGSQGIQGNTGIQGENGQQGIQGSIGAQGNTGIQGETGQQGIQGSIGAQGIQGTVGVQGAQGIQGIQGQIGSQGTTGIQGIQGRQGVQGITGLGTQGAQGIQGQTGPQGIQGITGAGTQGAQGIQGQTGPQGIQGITGAGTQGTQGIQGFEGIQGIQGIQGITGDTGEGTQGIQGFDGTQGAQGLQGIQGITGSKGVLNWSTQTSNYTASRNEGVISNTSGGSFTVTLPDSPLAGDIVVIADGANWGLFSLTVARNGSTIEGQLDDFVLDISQTRVDFIYDGETWQVYANVGPQGPQGLQGIEGITGAQGIQGIEGIDGINGFLRWSIQTSNYTASNLDGIIANTSGGTFTVTLPATPSAGNIVVFADGANWGASESSNLIVARNGSTIEGQLEDFVLDISQTRVDFVYDGATWQIYANVGPQGAQGLQGTSIQGTTGSQGTQGIEGADGIQGFLRWSNETSNYTASNLDGVIANTSNGTFTVTLPATPSAGNIVVFADGANWGASESSNLIVARNGSTIEGQLEDFILDISQTRVDFIYDGVTWQIYANVGPQGAQGIQGTSIQGVTGSQGIQGIEGIDGINGFLSWSTQTSNYTASNLDGVIANTSGGSFTVTLPTTPVIGAIVVIADGANWGASESSNLVVARNGSTIEGQLEDFVLDISQTRVDFVYDGATWQVYTNAGPQGADGVDGLPIVSINPTATSRTFLASDANNMIFVTSSSVSTITIPNDSTLNFPIGTVVYITQDGAGQVTIANEGNVVVRIRSGLTNKTAVRYSTCNATKVASNTWYLFGDLE